MKAFISRFLDPLDAVVELIYGVLIIMTFTMAIGVTGIGSQVEGVIDPELQALMIAAFGCAVAWGVIDSCVYLMTCVAERNHAAKVLRDVHNAPTEDAAIELVADAMEDHLIPITDEENREAIYAEVAAHLQETKVDPTWIKREDVNGAISIFLVAMIATLPVVIPFFLMRDDYWAMRVSNLLSLTTLFLAGYWWARQTGTKPVRTGLVVAALGFAVVAIAIPLGG